jgi:hypothetical protein
VAAQNKMNLSKAKMQESIRIFTQLMKMLKDPKLSIKIPKMRKLRKRNRKTYTIVHLLNRISYLTSLKKPLCNRDLWSRGQCKFSNAK